MSRNSFEPLEALENCVAFSSRDWSVDKGDAWIYGIVIGWSDADPEFDAMDEVARQHGWDSATVERLKILNEKFKEMSGGND